MLLNIWIIQDSYFIFLNKNYFQINTKKIKYDLKNEFNFKIKPCQTTLLSNAKKGEGFPSTVNSWL